jgi:hypothetical protein
MADFTWEKTGPYKHKCVECGRWFRSLWAVAFGHKCHGA